MKRNQTLTFVAKELRYRSVRRYRTRANFLFRSIPIEGKRVLDVGCGRGTFSLWAGLHGAAYVLGIEPEEAGSTSGVFQTFCRLIDVLNLNHIVKAKNQTLQEISPPKPFDIIILYNVINHLDEEAVSKIHEDPDAFTKYLSLARHLRSLLKEKGWLILADCSRENAWHYLNMTPPLARNIKWDKHQQPETWIKLFSQASFNFHDLRWSPLYPFGVLSANRLVQYLTTSHFILRFRAVNSDKQLLEK